MLNQTKNQLYKKAKKIKKSYNDCFTGISQFTKKELLYYINNCQSEYRNDPLLENVFSVDGKICNQSHINIDNQNSFEEYIFSPDFNPDNVELRGRHCNIINIVIDRDSDIYRTLNPGTEYLKFDKIKNIGSGSYGSIFLFYNFDYNIEFALKKEAISQNYGLAPIEEHIGDLLNDPDNYCNTIKVKYIKQHESFSYYILNRLEGDLDSLVTNLNDIGIDNPEIKDIKCTIAEEVRHQVLCLYNLDNDYIYTDLKLGNILYGCPDRENLNEFKIHLGDLGSAMSDIDGNYISTYLPYEFKNTRGFINFNGDDQLINGFLSWVIGLVLLDLIGNRVSDRLLGSCLWGRIDSISEADFRNTCDEMGDLLVDYYGNPDLRNYLKFDSRDRPDITHSLM